MGTTHAIRIRKAQARVQGASFKQIGPGRYEKEGPGQKPKLLITKVNRRSKRKYPKASKRDLRTIIKWLRRAPKRPH